MMGAILRATLRPVFAIAFLLVFLPLNLVLRALGRNPMGLRYDTKLTTYRRLSSTKGNRS